MSFSTRTPMTDTQRVLGQIERGEVRAGAEAARQIAARHQAAYGNDVWGPCPDTAWADAITDLTTRTTEGRPPVNDHASPHPLAGQTVTVTAELSGTGPHDFLVEDWNDRLFGQSWMDMQGHPASLAYAVRSAIAGLPTDNEVVYGKVQGLGYLVHVSEIADGAA